MRTIKIGPVETALVVVDGMDNFEDLPKDDVETEIDPRDLDTPDAWVPRHPALIRLTGNHPFNSQTTLKTLMEHGFLTPPSLHFVRNHGACPNLQWESHQVLVKGLVGQERAFSMDEIAQMPSISIPVTLVSAAAQPAPSGATSTCRSAGLSTNMWTGVRLRDLLLACKVDEESAKFVSFIGEDTYADGKYGATLDLKSAMDPMGDVMLAYKQNDINLLPDHGFPVRVIVPGWTAGRMVKWLRVIEVSDRLPCDIRLGVASPGHQESATVSDKNPLVIKGFAYASGGRKITKVEVSMDDSRTWAPATVTYPEEACSSAPQNDRYWCWAFWNISLPHSRLSNLLSQGSAPIQIHCRASDSSGTAQWERIHGPDPGFLQVSGVHVTFTLTQNGDTITCLFTHPGSPPSSSPS